ncbi:MAG: hypothetical protein FWD03_09000 [Defluviitaleaceae bacterium]|nr:hypothetical protein [Defluviitaleaceae bacterium]
MGPWDIGILIFVIIAVIGAAVYFLNRWASKRMVDHSSMVERTKQTVSMYIIDKKKEKMQNANFPKAVLEQIPRWHKFMKMPLVKAKIGPQIMTLMCDKQVFDALPVKKTVKVDLAGIYIVSMKGMKTKQEMAALRRERKGDGDALPLHKRLLGLIGR